jgi:hypothetical protein
MAIAPDRKPYEHTHVIHTSNNQNSNNRLAQHSLSPEKLGVVGYVKDVAGFVKDVVHERQEKRAIARRNSASSITTSEKNNDTTVPIAEVADDARERRRSSAEHQIKSQQQQSTPFADAVTGLFPGVNTIGDVNAAGCTHADELRGQMMHVNDRQQHDNTHKIL